MNKKQFLISLVFVSVFSFLGGIVGGVIRGGTDIFAKDDTSWLTPKKIDFIESKMIKTKELRAKEITLYNKADKVIGKISSQSDGNPYIFLFSNSSPMEYLIPKSKNILEMKPKEIDEIFSKGKFTTATFAIGIVEDEPHIAFSDKDLDNRISLGVLNLEPYMEIFYRNKSRLRIGTNYLRNKTTGTEEKIKGSICAFDNKGTLIGQLPYE
jgi:hypothetical protein